MDGSIVHAELAGGRAHSAADISQESTRDTLQQPQTHARMLFLPVYDSSSSILRYSPTSAWCSTTLAVGSRSLQYSVG